MSSGFDNHNSSIHQHRHHFLRHKSIFLPMLCRLSIKDIKLNRRRKDPTFSDDPSSPKVSCMGQVKRNNRRVTAAASPITTHHHSYSKLKRLFSTKALLPPVATATATAAACRSSKGVVCVNNLRRLDLKKECNDEKIVDVGELDPPLPVVKRAAPSGVGGEDGNLWRRRFEGAALKKLQIQHINLQDSCLKQPTV